MYQTKHQIVSTVNNPKECGVSGDGFVCEDDVCRSESGSVVVEGDCEEAVDFETIQSDLIINNDWGKAHLREIATKKKPGETIHVHAMVLDTPFDFNSFKNASEAEVIRLLTRRKALLEPSQKRVELLIETLGGTVHGRTWLVPGVNIEIPAASVESLILLIGRSDILAINPAVDGTLHAAYRGEEITEGTLSQQLEDANYYGESGGRSSSGSNNIKIGIAEEGSSSGGNFNCGHVGWYDYAGGPNRVKDTDSCNSTSCSGYTTCNTNGQHTTTVAWVAAGSIEQGQDSAYPGTNTLAQRNRSGVAREAELYVYHWTGSNCGLSTALQQAVIDGVDVFNISWGWGDCNINQNPCSINAAIVNATNAGMIVVASSGNDKPLAADSWCSVDWPANRPTVISVSGLNSPDSTVDYDDLLFHTGRSYGFDYVDMYNITGSLGTAMVDLVAPSIVENHFSGALVSGPAAYPTQNQGGTSFAAPAVSGIAGLMRNWQSSFGWSLQDDARAIFANTLVLGDGYNGYAADQKYLHVSAARTGYGRVRAHWPSTASLGSSRSWNSWKRTISHGDVVYLNIGGNPQSSAKNGAKVAAVYFDEDFLNVADIKVELVDTCPSGGGEVLVRAASQNPLRKKFRAANIANKCLAVKLTGSNVPSPQSVYIAAYTYSNSPDLH